MMAKCLAIHESENSKIGKKSQGNVNYIIFWLIDYGGDSYDFPIGNIFILFSYYREKYFIHVNQQTQDFRLLDIYFRKILPVCFNEHMSHESHLLEFVNFNLNYDI